MSNPQNPLDKFSTYSVSQTLIMCDGIKTADALYGSNQVFTVTNDDPEQLFDVQTIKGRNGGTGKYIVMFDGRKESRYFIKSIKWNTRFIPVGPDGSSKFEQAETDGELVIEEPYGVEFLEALVKGTSAMGVEAASVLFVLKTQFVGFYSNGDQGVIDDVSPFTFMMSELKADIKLGGAVYNIEFFGAVNGVSHLPQISRISGGITVDFKDGEPLRDAFKRLAIEINLKYRRLRTKVKNNLITNVVGIDTVNQAEDALFAKYSNVKYNIIVDEKYSDPKYTVGGELADIKKENGAFTLKFPPDASVETCIKMLMATCKSVNEEAVENKDTHTSKTPKVTSSLVPSDDDDTYQVSYLVRQYTMEYQIPGVLFKPKDGQFIEYDYFYTGKNVDILDLDIKMELGLAFFQTPIGPVGTGLSQNQTLSENADSQYVTAGSENNSLDESLGSDKTPEQRKSPLFLGSQVNPKHFTNNKNPARTATFESSLQRFAALESVQAQLKITGNPTLLNETLADGLLTPETINDDPALGDQFTRPGYIKVNIKYPSDKSLTGTKEFWYDGFYYIFQIANEFSDGAFTQTIDLFSLPSSSELPESFADKAEEEILNKKTTFDKLDYSTEDTVVELGEEAESEGFISKIINDKVKFEKLPEGANANDPNSDVDIWYKHTAKVDTLNIVIENILDDIVEIWKQYAPGIKPVVTSGNDSTHKVGSLHGRDLAIDLRANNLDPDPAKSIALGKQIARALQIRVNDNYDVIYETYANYFNNHIHVEFDPKTNYTLAEGPNEGLQEH